MNEGAAQGGSVFGLGGNAPVDKGAMQRRVTVLSIAIVIASILYMYVQSTADDV